FRVIFLLGNTLFFWVASNYLRNRKLPASELAILSTLVTAAMMLLVHSQHFATLFVALETVTIGLYAMVSYARLSRFSLEAGIKYLILGGTSTAVLLFGIGLLYGAGGNSAFNGSVSDPLQFSQLSAFLDLNQGNAIARLGVLMVLASVAFKIGLVPFQIWILDVYQGAPTPVTAFLAVSSKAAGLGILLILVKASGPFEPMRGFLTPILTVVTLITLVYGNLVALAYTNVKRLLGMSGISHAGFLMIGVLVLMSEEGVMWISGALTFYLLVYLVGSYAVFGVMSVLNPAADEDQDLYDYTHLSEKRPGLAAMIAMGLGSMAGIPPLGGFVAKAAVFIAAWYSGMFTLVFVGLACVVVSIYYYFKWIREAYYSDPMPDYEGEEAPQGERSFPGARLGDKGVFILLGAALLILGLMPGNLISLLSSF
ncbi:MAG TPA: NADH-quinone oxidoreductase subunit N, partial [Opitutales bacterium]|nr:NADH-quinone oxidoreductase subunit N [Opitutales bacterium]